MRNLNIRDALVSDAEICSEVLCASIRELCISDHGGDEQLISRWVENKTPENFRNWIQDSGMTIHVAEISEAIVAVGGIDDVSGITLNYVAPDYRFRGVSKKMLRSLESVLRVKGAVQAKLTSTEAAHSFYQAAGWQDVAEPEIWLGMKGYPMSKRLSI